VLRRPLESAQDAGAGPCGNADQSSRMTNVATGPVWRGKVSPKVYLHGKVFNMKDRAINQSDDCFKFHRFDEKIWPEYRQQKTPTMHFIRDNEKKSPSHHFIGENPKSAVILSNIAAQITCYILIIISIILIIAALNIRTFNDWRETHWLFTYDYGFIKRGLIGTVTHKMFQNKASTEEFIYILSILSLIILCILCIILLVRNIIQYQSLTILILALVGFRGDEKPLAW
jgi:hypothetical protein